MLFACHYEELVGLPVGVLFPPGFHEGLVPFSIFFLYLLFSSLFYENENQGWCSGSQYTRLSPLEYWIRFLDWVSHVTRVCCVSPSIREFLYMRSCSVQRYRTIHILLAVSRCDKGHEYKHAPVS